MKVFFYILALLFITAGCAHYHPVEVPTPAPTKTPLKFGIGSKEVSVGDRVQIFKKTCQQQFHDARRPKPPKCSKDVVTEGTVQSLLNEEESMIVPDTDLVVDRALLVEKIK